MTKKNLFSAALWMAGLSAFSKVLGLIRESALAAQFGATGVTDAYKIAFSLPNIFFAVIAAAISQTFIPVYADYLKEGDEKKNNHFLSNLINWIILCSIVLLVFLYAGLPIVIQFIAPGFDPDTLSLTIELASIMLPAAVFFILSNLASAYLQSHNRFIAPSLVWYPHNFFIIGSIMLGGIYGIKGVAWGSLFAFVSMLLIQIHSVIRAGFKYRFVLSSKDAGVKQIIRLSGPVLVGTAFGQIYIVIDRILASGLTEGSITALDYANRVNSLAYNIFVLTIATVLYPTLSNVSEDAEKFSLMVGKSLRIMMLIALPITVGLIILQRPIIQLLFERGAFDSNDTLMTSCALAGLSVGLCGMAFREILNRAFYALKDTITPMINGITAIIFNIVFCVILVRDFGIVGLAIGTSFAALLSGCMLLMRLKKKLKAIGGRWIIAGMVKVLISSTAMAFITSITYLILRSQLGNISEALWCVVSIVLSGSLGSASYICVLWLLKMEELFELKDLVLKKFKIVKVA